MPTPTIGQSFPELLAIHDADMDGLSDDKELDIGTDMNRADTDGDGWPDGAERDGRSDPLDSKGKPTDIYVARPVVQIIIPGRLTIPIGELIFQNGFERPSGEWIELIGLGYYIAAPTSISVVLPAQGDVNGLTTNVTIAAPRRIQVIRPAQGEDDSLAANVTIAGPTQIQIVRPGQGETGGLQASITLAGPTDIQVVRPGLGEIGSPETSITIANPSDIQVNWEEEP